MTETGSHVVAVILTLDEAEHLPGCLASLAHLTDDVIILDSGSTDGTVDIARAAGARVETRAFEGYASQRNAALALAGDAPWVLFLDADERLTPAGAQEICNQIAVVPDSTAALWLPRRNVFFGRALRAGGWSPDHQARVFRRGRVRYDETRQVHEVAIIQGESTFLGEPIVHLNYATRMEFVRKQRHYTNRRVREEAGSFVPRRRAYLSAPARELHRRLIRHRGYRDGVTGFFVAGVLAIEEIHACRMLRREIAP